MRPQPKASPLIDQSESKEAWHRPLPLLGVALLLGLLLLVVANTVSPRDVSSEDAVVLANELPEQARETLALIKRGGPYPFAQDGAVFANRERRLPIEPRGTYREYTVKTPGRRDRGGRRIIAASSGALWYTEDHYRSFRRIVE